MSLKKKSLVSHVLDVADSGITNESRYRTKTIPAAGALLKGDDTQEKQVKFDV
jgi:DNA gyrase subunit A